MSISPKLSTASLMNSFQLSASDTSNLMNFAFSLKLSASSLPLSSCTSPNTTFAPCDTNSLTIASPNPWAPPVTIATLPLVSS